ncbi:aldehyde dehydrogenase, mitochondrial precursor [Trypanosoma cruzi]|nr:aldehyde dehydrogenase, mitochondrial precursor [Trypanosoma cruzi]
MTVAPEGIFGPVTCVVKSKTLGEAIERTNSTTCDLAAGVCTLEVEEIVHCASCVKACTVWAKCWNCFDATMPFGGFKQRAWRAVPAARPRDQIPAHCTQGAVGEEVIGGSETPKSNGEVLFFF